MTEGKQTIKIWKSTLTNLRMLAALTDKRMVVLLDEMVRSAVCEQGKVPVFSDDDAERDSPNSLGTVMAPLKERGYKRVNDPRKKG